MPSSDWLGLADKLAIVTGAAGGIGRAIALGFAEAGCRLALLDRDREGLAAIADQLQATGARIVAIPCDMSDQAAIIAAAEKSAAALGPADILVNNAGILRAGPLAELSLADWNTLLSINLTGYLLAAQAVRPQMVGRGGALVHIASIAARRPAPPAPTTITS
jgi:NAD(P)-dependent dehydrogenase (short-subunit alcohol dehydrogenase family)